MPQSAIYQFLASSELDLQLHDRRRISRQICPLGELALRKAISANTNMKAIQDSLEDISYLLRIPQRKPYGTMEGNVKKALKVNSVRYAAMELGLTVDGDSFVACVMSTREEKAPNCALSARPDTNVSKDHEWRQAVTTAGSGCIAALSVERYLTNNNLLVEFHQPKTEEVKKELTATSADSQAQKLLCRKLQNCRVALFGICLLGNWSWHGVWIVVDVMYAATNADSQAFSGC